MARKRREPILADPPAAPPGTPGAAPTMGSILDELDQAAPPELGPLPETPAGKKRGGRKKTEPEPAPPSPFGPFGKMTRGLAEPYYTALGVECPAEMLWIMWAEQGGDVLRYYMPDMSDHPLVAFTLSSLLLASPIMAKVAEGYVKSSASHVHLRGPRDGQEHAGPLPHIGHTPRPSA